MARSITHPEIHAVQLADVLHALADPVRLQIVRMAAGHAELPCNEFLREIPKSTMSHHWRILRQAGVIRQRGEGVQRMNSLRREELDQRFPGLLDAVLKAPCGHALAPPAPKG